MRATAQEDDENHDDQHRQRDTDGDRDDALGADGTPIPGMHSFKSSNMHPYYIATHTNESKTTVSEPTNQPTIHKSNDKQLDHQPTNGEQSQSQSQSMQVALHSVRFGLVRCSTKIEHNTNVT